MTHDVTTNVRVQYNAGPRTYTVLCTTCGRVGDVFRTKRAAGAAAAAHKRPPFPPQ